LTNRRGDFSETNWGDLVILSAAKDLAFTCSYKILQGATPLE
jgi:hypothetical protein